jgi:hypothetical protein
VQEASEGRADLSDEEPEIVARLILFMYYGQDHPPHATSEQESMMRLAKLLDRPGDTIIKNTLSVQAALIAAADKYQMPDTLVDCCQAAYNYRVEAEWCSPGQEVVIDFIASVKIIYQSSPAAGLRGRAITTAQSNIAELQHVLKFRELLLATPEFAIDLATKGVRHGFWCRACVSYTNLPEDELLTDYCRELWDLIDYEKSQDWEDFNCALCKQKGACTDVKPEGDVS